MLGTGSIFQLQILEDDLQSVGTHVDMNASINAAKIADIPMLQDAEELNYEDFDNLTTSEVNKLDGQDWKKRSHPSVKETQRSVFEDSTLSTVSNLSDALKRFKLDPEGRLNEREMADLFRT